MFPIVTVLRTQLIQLDNQNSLVRHSLIDIFPSVIRLRLVLIR